MAAELPSLCYGSVCSFWRTWGIFLGCSHRLLAILEESTYQRTAAQCSIKSVVISKLQGSFSPITDLFIQSLNELEDSSRILFEHCCPGMSPLQRALHSAFHTALAKWPQGIKRNVIMKYSPAYNVWYRFLGRAMKCPQRAPQEDFGLNQSIFLF